ncbi:MAG: hypothetical protein GQ574_12230 [Crocinitomix sp.]|nr:hypothetical protein [Crocinitomix sp.]
MKPIIEWHKIYNMIRRGIIILLLGFTVLACQNQVKSSDNSVEEDSVQWIDFNEIVTSSVPLSELSEADKEQIGFIHESFIAVNSNSLIEWEDGFELDLNPSVEIEVWTNMAIAYNAFTSNHELSQDQKSEAYKVVLLRSLMSNEDVIGKNEFEFLSIGEINEILESYTKAPKPLSLIQM